MSYYSDHLAWQQRVTQEVNAANHVNEFNKTMGANTFVNYPDLLNYLQTSHVNRQNVNNTYTEPYKNQTAKK